MTDFRIPTFIAFHNAPISKSRYHAQHQQHRPRPLQHGIFHQQNHAQRHPSKRRETEPAHPEPVLLSLCRYDRWEEALLRCETHPEEAVPVVLQLDTANPKPWKRDRKNESPQSIRKAQGGSPFPVLPLVIYQQTVLGLVCASSAPDNEMKVRLTRALVRASPHQLTASQNLVGCTPLRDLMLRCSIQRNGSNNMCCDMLEALLAPDKSSKVVSMRDMSGLTPVDHLVMRLHLNPCQQSLDVFRCYVDMVESQCLPSKKNQCPPSSASPLMIRLLSLAQNVGNNGSSKEQQDKIFDIILECIQYLLEKNPSRIYDASKSSGCNVLHVALRNFGDQLSLIQLLLDTAAANHGSMMLAQRNVFGDLPLHVACAGGSPMPILKLIIQQTLNAATAANDDSPHPLIWSTNNAGYTPVDLEWMRHIEGGGGLNERRTFYPLEERGLRCESFGHEGMYQSLLCQAVDQVMHKSDTGHNLNNEEGHDTINKDAPLSFLTGALLDRIMLIVQMAYSGRNNIEGEHDKYLLHAASSLAGGSGPYLPQPLLFLFHWMYRDQTRICDGNGRLPLHYSLMKRFHRDKPETALLGDSSTPPENKESIWINTLTDSYPEGARVADKMLRLPLHYALDSPHYSSDHADTLVDKLIHQHPESLERRDPITGLYPFQQAAVAAADDLNTCFLLLRRAPNLVVASSS